VVCEVIECGVLGDKIFLTFLSVYSTGLTAVSPP